MPSNDTFREWERQEEYNNAQIRLEREYREAGVFKRVFIKLKAKKLRKEHGRADKFYDRYWTF